MELRAARRLRPQKRRFALAGRSGLWNFRRVVIRRILLVTTFAIASGGAATFISSPASAASPGDTVYVYDGSGSLVDQPLPAGTPDVVTPLGSELFSLCDSVGEVSPEPGYYGVAGLCAPELLQTQNHCAPCWRFAA
jgi:hypothetical protein